MGDSLEASVSSEDDLTLSELEKESTSLIEHSVVKGEVELLLCELAVLGRVAKLFDEIVSGWLNPQPREWLEMVLDEAHVSIEANDIVVKEIGREGTIEEEVPDIEDDFLGSGAFQNLRRVLH